MRKLLTVALPLLFLPLAVAQGGEASDCVEDCEAFTRTVCDPCPWMACDTTGYIGEHQCCICTVNGVAFNCIP